jgi:amidase
MRFEEYVQHDALGLAALVRQGEVQAVELLELALARAEQVNPQLNVLVTRLYDRARARCAQPFDADAPFAGVPFLLKDLFQDIAGIPTSCGNRALARLPMPNTSDVVRRWQNAGLVIFGKTNAPEFGARAVTEPRHFGPTRNPWDTNRTPGGSSGGSAAAVAAGIVPAAGANDGGGSIRIPAACCGLFGFKAGRGRISMGPDVGEGLSGAAVQGVVTRSVRDTAAMLDVLQGPEPHAPYFMPPPEQPYLQAMAQAPRRLRIGFSSASPIGTPVDPEAIKAVEAAAKLLESLGHHVEPANAPGDGQAIAQDFLTAWFAAQAYLIDRVRNMTGASLSDFEPDTRLLASIGRTMSAADFMKCESNWHQHVLALTRFHAQYDLWLSPTLSAPPVSIGTFDTPRTLQVASSVIAGLKLSGWLGRSAVFKRNVINNLAWTPYTQLANITGRPAMSVPLHWTAKGLPLGVQFLGPLNSEALLLQLAHQLEQASPWFGRRPSI